MKTGKARKKGKIRAAAAVAAIFLLAGRTCQVYGAEPENPVQITEEGRAAGADEMPETPADVQIQNPAEQLKAPVSAPDGTLPEFSDSPPDQGSPGDPLRHDRYGHGGGRASAFL